MTNLEAIKQGKHKGFNELLKKSDAYTLAEMISANSCKECICKTYCTNHICGSCQDVVEDWLNEEEEE